MSKLYGNIKPEDRLKMSKALLESYVQKKIAVDKNVFRFKNIVVFDSIIPKSYYDSDKIEYIKKNAVKIYSRLKMTGEYWTDGLVDDVVASINETDIDKNLSKYDNLCIYIDMNLLLHLIETYDKTEADDLVINTLDDIILPAVKAFDTNGYDVILNCVAEIMNDTTRLPPELKQIMLRDGYGLTHTWSTVNRQWGSILRRLTHMYMCYVCNEFLIVRSKDMVSILNRFINFIEVYFGSRQASFVGERDLFTINGKGSLFGSLMSVDKVFDAILSQDNALTMNDTYAYDKARVHAEAGPLASENAKMLARVSTERSSKKEALFTDSQVKRSNNDTQPSSVGYYRESLCDYAITKNSFKSRDVMLASLRIQGYKLNDLYSEFLGIDINMTETEKLNDFARKVDKVAIAFESMANQWEKEDAFNLAHDVLDAIDKERDGAKNESYLLSLDNIRKDLNELMEAGRKNNVQLKRTQIVIATPQGYDL